MSFVSAPCQTAFNIRVKALIKFVKYISHEQSLLTVNLDRFNHRTYFLFQQHRNFRFICHNILFKLKNPEPRQCSDSLMRVKIQFELVLTYTSGKICKLAKKICIVINSTRRLELWTIENVYQGCGVGVVAFYPISPLKYFIFFNRTFTN